MFLASMHLDILTPALEGELKGLYLSSCLQTLLCALILLRGCRNRPNSSKRSMSVSTTMPLTACRETNALVRMISEQTSSKDTGANSSDEDRRQQEMLQGSAFWATLIK